LYCSSGHDAEKAGSGSRMYSRAASAKSGRSGLSRATVTPALPSRSDNFSSAARTDAAVGKSGCVSMTSTRKSWSASCRGGGSARR
jgi:hypothetical protein